MPELTFTLAPRPPFRLDLTVWALRRRPHNVVDRFEDQTWRRVIVTERSAIALAVTQTRGGERPEIEVHVAASRPREVKPQVAALVTKMLGLDCDLSEFYRLAHGDKRLEELADHMRGMKPVRYATVFEAFANAVACQLVSLSAGMHVLNRLAEAFGAHADSNDTPMHAFPTAAAIARTDPDALRQLGLSRQKGEYLVGLARMAIDRRDLDFASIERLSDADAIERLSKIRGVGRWTAEYVMLRGFGRLGVFPGDDVGGRKKLIEWFGGTAEPTYDSVGKMLARWRPYGGLIYLHLVANAAIENDSAARFAAV